MSFSSLSKASWTACAALRVVLGLGVAGERLERSPPRRPWSRPGARACPRPGSRASSASPKRSLISLEHRLVDLRRRRPRPSPCRPSRAARAGPAQSFLISPWAMSSASRISASEISLAPASTIRMASSVPATTRSSGGLEQPLLVRVDDEVAVLVLADAHGADRHREGDVRDHQRGAGAVHREDVVGVHVVDRHRDRRRAGSRAPALREERADRAVDHARGERGLLAGATLALEEAAGDLARGVHALLDVDGQREEVDVAEVACGGGAEHHRVPCGDDDGAARLLGELAGLERDLGSADLDGDAAHSISHMFLSPPPVGGRLRLAAWLKSPFRCEPAEG